MTEKEQFKCVFNDTIGERNYVIDELNTRSKSWLEPAVYGDKLNKWYFAFLEIKKTDAIYELVAVDNFTSVSKIQRILSFKAIELMGYRPNQPSNDGRRYIGFSTYPPSHAKGWNKSDCLAQLKRLDKRLSKYNQQYKKKIVSK